MLDRVSRWLKLRLDQSFHKFFGLPEGGLTLNPRELASATVAPPPTYCCLVCGERVEFPDRVCSERCARYLLGAYDARR